MITEKYYVIYSTAVDRKGLIVRSGRCPERMLEGQCNTAAGEALLEASGLIDGLSYYVTDALEVAPRKTYTLDGLPLPCVLKIDGERYDITEQPSLSFEWPGTYAINVIPASPAYLEMEFTHTVTEAEATGVANVEPNY